MQQSLLCIFVEDIYIRAVIFSHFIVTKCTLMMWNDDARENLNFSTQIYSFGFVICK